MGTHLIYISMSSPLRLATLASLVALSACDSGIEPPTLGPPPFTVAIVADGDTVLSTTAAPSADLAAVPVASVALAPRLGEPADPALSGRYHVTQALVNVLNATSDEPYEVGHYLVRVVPDAGAAVATVPFVCEGTEYTLLLGDARLDAPGAVFFPVREGAARGPTVAFRAFGLGGAGRLVFDGAGDTATVEASALDAPPLVVTTTSQGATVEVTRGSSIAEAAVVTRRGAEVDGRFVRPAALREGMPLPLGAGPVEVYLFQSAADDPEGVCPEERGGQG